MTDPGGVSLREKVRAVSLIAKYRPRFTAGIVVFSLFTAILEGIGISFLVPVIEVVTGNSSNTGGIQGAFLRVYEFLGVPFTLEYIILGVTLVMTTRFTASFFVSWYRGILRTNYIRDLQAVAFDCALDARIAYFDERGSDEILNAVITQTRYAGEAIKWLVNVLRQLLLCSAYLLVAFFFSPMLTVLTVITLGGIFYLIRYVIEPGYAVGDRVADANERIQTAVQAGTQGIRDVKLFDMTAELYDGFQRSIDQFADATITLRRNEAAINSSYRLLTALTVFFLIYVALEYLSLSLSALGVFLFAMFRLAPEASLLNQEAYKLAGDLPHFIRTNEFIDEIESQGDVEGGEAVPPDPVEHIAFDDVTFSYDGEERVLDQFSFEVENGEFVAFVGQSGAGKSTLVSLLARLYEPDQGEITVNGTPIEAFDVATWRSRLAVVRQSPHIFNDTLRYNLTIGNRSASREEIERVCEIARVTEFLDGLPNGYHTVLGDEGVQLSGGQRQRVALARALLTDADVLVLDEATSDLDSDLERQVQREIEAMDREYAIIAIAHRLSTVANADTIYTVEDGRVIEVGEHEELIDNGGEYARLYAIQST